MSSVKIIAASDAGNLVCAASGRISTTQGTALEILARSREKENNASLIEKVVASGHQSVVEHAMFSLAFDNVSVCVEEFVIEYRLASFTVQSRRYVDFSNAGFYTPPMPEELVPRYESTMQALFDAYAKLLDLQIPKEDARFVLPYCFHSNFYCTMNARELMHMIQAMLWGRGSVYPELRSLGESLREQFDAYFPNLLARMAEKQPPLSTRYRLPDTIPEIPAPTPKTASVTIRSATPNAEQLILEAAASNGIAAGQSALTLEDIVHDERPRELELVNATFRITNLSLAAVTHLVRHRMQSILIPPIMQAILKNEYVMPSAIAKNEEASLVYRSAIEARTDALRELLQMGMPIAAMQYFAVAGNQLDVTCSMNGRELLHFCKLRTCTRAQWEINICATSLLSQLRMHSPELYGYYGASCYVLGKCPEGRLSCGRAKEMQAYFQPKP